MRAGARSDGRSGKEKGMRKEKEAAAAVSLVRGRRDRENERARASEGKRKGRRTAAGRFGKWIVRLFSSKRGCAEANKIHQLVSPVDGRASRSS